jgi:hypothetical protein
VAVGQIYGILKYQRRIVNSPDINSIDMHTLNKRINFMVLVYLLIAPFLIVQLGGTNFLFKRVRNSDSVQNLPISIDAILQSFLYVPPLIILLVLLYNSKFFKVSKLKIVFFLTWILLLSNPLGNARQTTLFLLLPLVFVYIKSRQRIASFFFILLPFFFIYSSGIVDRYSGEIRMPKLSLISRNGDFDAFSQIANGVQVIPQGVFPLFRQIFGSILFFVPRGIWPAKPNDTGIELAKILGLEFQNLSAPWILEAYVNARFMGVILVAFFIGFYITKLDQLSNVNVQYFVLGSVASGFLFIVLRGSLLQATGRATFSVILIYLIFRKLHKSSFSNEQQLKI